MPNSSAFAALDPAFSPTTTQSVFLLTEPAAFPPWEIMASLAESREKSTNDPVTTTVLPAKVCGRSLVSATTPTPAVFHASNTVPRQLPGSCAAVNHVTTDSAISGPIPSIAESSSTLACSIASSEPKAVAMVRAVGGPRRRIDSATSTRHKSTCLAFSISSSILRVFSAGRTYTGCTLVTPVRDTLVSSRITTASAGTLYSGYSETAAPFTSSSASFLAESFLAEVGAVQNAGT